LEVLVFLVGWIRRNHWEFHNIGQLVAGKSQVPFFCDINCEVAFLESAGFLDPGFGGRRQMRLQVTAYLFF
jgi:hypothetical protein